MVNLKNYLLRLISLKILSSIILFSFISVSANNRGDWFDKLSEINLGKTSRKGVEKLFNPTNIVIKNESEETTVVTYSIGDGFINVAYSSGNGCSEITNMGYKLDKDIAVSYFFVESEIKFSRLGIKIEELVFNEWDDEAERIYANPKPGRYYNIKNKSIITFVGQTFTSEQLKKYSCEHFIKQY